MRGVFLGAVIVFAFFDVALVRFAVLAVLDGQIDRGSGWHGLGLYQFVLQIGVRAAMGGVAVLGILVALLVLLFVFGYHDLVQVSVVQSHPLLG